MPYRAKFIKSRKCYFELGQFGYEGETYTEDIGEKIGTNVATGEKYYYVGQFLKGTNLREGIGITVRKDGATCRLACEF